MPRAAASGAKKTPSAHKLAEQFPVGMILQDLCKQEWSLGPVIGKGGFGLIYLATRYGTCTVSSSTDFVIKIEPKENGPLYCEMQFYQRVAKKDCIDSFRSKNKLKYLGIPPFIGTGSITYKCNEYRFLVMDRFETDLQKLLVENGGTFSPKVVFAVGLRMIDALHFCHENEYVHADIKASNILLNKRKEISEVYLVDFGLAYRYTVNGVHKKYKEDPKQAHNGTIEFTSRDAHKGVAPSPRGDMEILGYCMLQWLCKKLPWEDNLKSAAYVASSKESFMKDIPTQIKSCLQDSHSSAETIRKYFELVKLLKYDDTPNYNMFKKILLDGLTLASQKDEWKIDFGAPKSRKRKSEGTEEPAAKKTKSPQKSPAASKRKIKNATPKAKRSPPVRCPLVKLDPIRSPLVKRETSSSDTSSPSPNRAATSKRLPAAKSRRLISAAKKSPLVDRKFPVAYTSTSKAKEKSPLTLTEGVRKHSTYVKRRRAPKCQVNASVQTSPCLKK